MPSARRDGAAGAGASAAVAVATSALAPFFAPFFSPSAPFSGTPQLAPFPIALGRALLETRARMNRALVTPTQQRASTQLLKGESGSGRLSPAAVVFIGYALLWDNYSQRHQKPAVICWLCYHVATR